MDDTEKIRKYIQPQKKDIIIFALFSVLMVLSVLFVIIMMISGRINDFEEVTLFRFTIGGGSFEFSGMLVIIVCVFFILMGRIVTDAEWKRVVIAGRNLRRSLAQLEIRGDSLKAQRELEASGMTEVPVIITENYIFSRHTGCAVRKSDITDYTVTKNKRRSGPPITGEGIMVRLTDGKWYELCGAKAGYPAQSMLEEEIKRILDKDPGAGRLDT